MIRHQIEVNGITYPNNGLPVDLYGALLKTIADHAPLRDGTRVELVVTIDDGQNKGPDKVTRGTLAAVCGGSGCGLSKESQYFFAPFGEIDRNNKP